MCRALWFLVVTRDTDILYECLLRVLLRIEVCTQVTAKLAFCGIAISTLNTSAAQFTLNLSILGCIEFKTLM